MLILDTVFFNATGYVFAFEPQKKIFTELNVNLLANRSKHVKTFHYALGNKIGPIEMAPPPANNEGHTKIGHGRSSIISYSR